MRSGFEIKGLASLIKAMEGLVDEDIPQLLHDCLEQLGIWLLALAQKRTPIDTGELYESFTRGNPANIWRLDVTRQTVQLILGSTAEHALPIEEGHWTNPEGVERRWVPGYWVGDKFVYDPNAETGMSLKQQWVPGYHMFEIAFEELSRMAPAYLTSKLQGVFDRASRSVRA